MNPHGTNARYVKGCRCEPCTRAAFLYSKARRLDFQRGHRRTVPAIGAHRRLRALRRIGWALGDIAAEAGRSKGWAEQVMLRPVIRRATAAEIVAVYDRLCMTPGTSTIAIQRAEAKGWPPPLAWDDSTIDDPTAQPWTDDGPRGAHVKGRGAVNLDSLTDCAEWGLSVQETADRLDVSRDAVEHGIARHAPHLHERFARNAIAKGVAA